MSLNEADTPKQWVFDLASDPDGGIEVLIRVSPSRPRKTGKAEDFDTSWFTDLAAEMIKDGYDFNF